MELADRCRIEHHRQDFSCMRLHCPGWKRAVLGSDRVRAEPGQAPEKEAIWGPADARFPTVYLAGRNCLPGCRNEAVVADAAERRAALVVGPSGVSRRGDAGGVGSEIDFIGSMQSIHSPLLALGKRRNMGR